MVPTPGDTRGVGRPGRGELREAQAVVHPPGLPARGPAVSARPACTKDE